MTARVAPPLVNQPLPEPQRRIEQPSHGVGIGSEPASHCGAQLGLVDVDGSPADRMEPVADRQHDPARSFLVVAGRIGVGLPEQLEAASLEVDGLERAQPASPVLEVGGQQLEGLLATPLPLRAQHRRRPPGPFPA